MEASPQVTLIFHRACTECQIIKQALDKHQVQYRTRDIWEAPLSREELLVLLEGQDLRPFLNPRSSEYRDRGMAERTPPLGMAVELIARDQRLLRCPILVKGDDVLPVIIESDAQVLPPEVLKFLGIELKKPAAAHGKPAAKPAAGAAGAPAKPAAPVPAAKPAAAKHAEPPKAPEPPEPA